MADRTIVNDGDMKKLHADLDSMLAWLGTQ
jgi:hypothetical protein